MYTCKHVSLPFPRSHVSSNLFSQVLSLPHRSPPRNDVPNAVKHWILESYGEVVCVVVVGDVVAVEVVGVLVGVVYVVGVVDVVAVDVGVVAVQSENWLLL